MKRLFLLLVFVSSLFCADLESLLKNVPKNSVEYSLDSALINKIKSLKFKKEQLNFDIKNEEDYLDTFYELVKLKKEQNLLPSRIEELSRKISLIEENSTTSKLQKIFFQKELKILKQKSQFLNKNLPIYEKKLYERLKNINFDVKNAEKNIRILKKQLKEAQKEYERLNIDLQKWQILGDEKEIKKIQNLIKKNKEYQNQIKRNLFRYYLILWSDYLKRKDKNALNVDNEVLSYAKVYGEDFYEALSEIVNDFEKYAFGSKLLVYNSKKELKLTLKKVWEILNYPLFTVGERTITPINFFIFVIVLILGWFIGKYYKKIIYSLRHRYDISQSTATLLANMGYYTIITLSFLIALKIVGLDLSSLAIIAGALSVGIGFGLQNVVSNFVSGIILMFERSIKVGDYIQIDENTRGEVIDISMRSTIIRTNDNINLIIPNQSFIQNNVINWTLGDDIVRFRVPFGVAYGSDVDKVEKVVLEAIKNSKVHFIKKHPTLDVEPRVVFIEMGDSSLNFELMVWVRGEYARRPRRTRSEFLKIIYKALNNAGIEIPFPQQDLHIRDSVPIEIKLKKN